MKMPDDSFNTPLPDLPEPLARELRGMYAPPPLPAGFDRGVLAAVRPGPARRWRLLVPLGIAASVALAAMLLWPALTAPTYARTGDIRDAFFVARQLQARRPLDISWDQNADGVVDGNDVQALAMAAVSVSRSASEGRGEMSP